jgi:hypothetical protein
MHWIPRDMLHKIEVESGDYDFLFWDRDFFQALAKLAPTELWEIIEDLNPGDYQTTVTNVGILASEMFQMPIERGGRLPIWYDVKPSEYQQRKDDLCRRLREIEKELSILAPQVADWPVTWLLWPQNEITLRRTDPLLDESWGDGDWKALARANDGLRAVGGFYRRRWNEEPAVTGEDGIFDKLIDQVKDFDPPRYGKPRSGAPWCRHFVMELNQLLTKDEEFKNLNRSKRLRLIELCIEFYGRWIGDEAAATEWNSKKIGNSIDG